MTQLATSSADRRVRKIGFLPRRLTRQPAVVAGATPVFVFFVKTGGGEILCEEVG
jgi:hypothetical protein